MTLGEYIDNYLKFHCTFGVVERGEKIYKRKKVLNANIDLDKDEAMFHVQGSTLYRVKIKGFISRNITTSCSCPYTWGEVCKHSVAALFFLKYEDYKNHTAVQQKKEPLPEPRKRKANQLYEITEYKKLTQEYVFDNLIPRLQNDLKYRQYQITLDSASNSALVFRMVLYGYSYYTVRVEIVYSNGKVYSKSDQGTTTEKLSIDEAFLFLYLIRSNFSDFFDFWFSDRKNTYKENFVIDYGLGKKAKFDDYFRLSFSQDQGILVLPNENAAGIIPAREGIKHPFLHLLKKITEPDIADPLQKEMKIQVPGFVLSIVEEKTGLTYDIITIKGKPAKGGNSLTSITEAEGIYDLEDVQLSDNQRILLDLISHLNKTRNNVEDRFKIWKKIVKHLPYEKYIYLNDYEGVRLTKSRLQNIKVSSLSMNLEFDARETRDFIELQPVLVAGESRFDKLDIDPEISTYTHSFINDTLYLNDSLKMCELLPYCHEPMKLPKDHFEALFGRVVKPLSGLWNVNFNNAGNFKAQEVRLTPQNKQVYLSELNDYLVIKLQVVYDHDVLCVLSQTSNILEFRDKTLFEFIRDHEFEKNFVDYVASLHPDFGVHQKDNTFYLSWQKLMLDEWFFGFFENLQNENIEVFGLKDLKKFQYSPYKAKINTGIKSGQDWFEVDVEVSFGDEIVNLRDIRKAAIRRQKYIQLNDGSFGILPDHWLEKLEKYFRNGELVKDKLNISKLRFSIVDELFDHINDHEILEEIARKRKSLKETGDITSVTVPETVTATLRNYQKEGLNWLHFLDKMKWGGILADDMGLGKTLQVLTFIEKIKSGSKNPSLIIAPTTLLFNWENEIRKFAPELKAFYYYGMQREKDTSFFSDYDLVFTTYGVLVRDISLFQPYKFNYVILDESQAIKNPESQRYKAVCLLKASNKIALTGTPVENSTFDLFAQMNFVNPGFLGSIKSFKENYSAAIDKEGNEAVALELQKIINPFILRRTKEQVARELPPKTEDIIYCEMEAEQRRIYDAYRNEYRNMLLKKIEDEGLEKSQMFVLQGLLKLRQICDSPALLNEEDVVCNESVKIKELIRYITDKTAHHKILVFSQFVTMLGLIREELAQCGIPYEYLDGQSSAKQRKESVNNFQGNDSLRVFLISLKAGGLGLNLTAADYVFIVDPWWNPAVEEQAIDRCYRIGQDKKVFAYRMICKNTIEEKIQNLQDKKRKIAGDLIKVDDESIMKGLKMKDIQELFG